jgi:hypothetical protein
VHDSLTVGSWAAITQGCPIAYIVRQSDNVSFMLGDDTSGEFELCFDAPGLQLFISLASEALPKMAEHQVQEQAERAAYASQTPGTASTTERTVSPGAR